MTKGIKTSLYVIAVLTVIAMAFACYLLLREKPVPEWRNKTQDIYIGQLGKVPALTPKQASQSDTSQTLAHIATTSLPGSYTEMFSDFRDVQQGDPRDRGILPADSLKRAFDVRFPLVKIASGPAFLLDSLTHSVPYLVPKAAKLLEDIGCAFADTVTARGGFPHRVIVTSVLRTPFTVNKLRKVNNNAVAESTHCYGTTFDISWIRYQCDAPGHAIEPGELKNILAEVLWNLREKDRCYVIYEEGQSCFHIMIR